MPDEVNGKGQGWLMLSVTLPRDLEETASTVLFDLGSTGIVTLSESETDVQIAGYFAASVDSNELLCQVAGGLSESGTDRSAEIAVSYVPDQDWLQKWKEGYEPVTVGERLLVVPSWKLESVMHARNAGLTDQAKDSSGDFLATGGSAVTGQSDRIIILIDPGMAFGTGTHETTRLCLQGIERYWRGGRLLDVGTGTAILAIAAEKLRPGSTVTGIDVDPVAVEVAKENSGINGVPEIHLRQAQPSDLGEASFDVVVANLTADLITMLLHDLIARVDSGGYLLLSGILREQAEDVAQALQASALNIVERSEAGEWVAFAATKK